MDNYTALNWVIDGDIPLIDIMENIRFYHYNVMGSSISNDEFTHELIDPLCWYGICENVFEADITSSLNWR